MRRSARSADDLREPCRATAASSLTRLTSRTAILIPSRSLFARGRHSQCGADNERDSARGIRRTDEQQRIKVDVLPSERVGCPPLIESGSLYGYRRLFERGAYRLRARDRRVEPRGEHARRKI